MNDINRTVALPAVCDLIMKGGITSGVIYPKLIGKLAKTYRLKNIGGTSAGAIAAAGAAAAEFQRHSSGSEAGFEKLNELPEELGSSIDGERSRLLTLFQPIPKLKRHFEILLHTLNVKVPLLAALEVAFQIVRHFPWPAVVILVFSTLLPWSSFLALTGQPTLALQAASVALATWVAITIAIRYYFRRKITESCGVCRPFILWLGGGLAAIFATTWMFNTTGIGSGVMALETFAIAAEILLAGLIAITGSIFAFSNSLLKGLSSHGFGLCSGHADAQGPEVLTDWLTGYFNELAGFGKTERPLSFGDLWRGVRNTDKGWVVPKDRKINFEAMTSAVSRKMPYRIPFTRDEEAYYFDPAEWKRLFPEIVLTEMKRLGADRTVIDPDNPGREFYPLPAAEFWPIVVAVRMSLSFPILLSAVPLYAIDFAELHWLPKPTLQPGQPEPRKRLKKVWFSDGGISSNMPLHFFDSFLPNHPTFAINLTDKHPLAGSSAPQQPAKPGYEDWRVYLPKTNNGGTNRTWKSPATDSVSGLIEFLLSIVSTMQNWRDELQFPYPGYRDRIVQISQSPDEGGLNLNMPATAIEALANAGENAGEELIQKFQLGDGWENHQRTRLRSLLTQLDLKLNDLDLSTLSNWQDLLNKMDKSSPYQFKNNAEKAKADQTLADLVRLAETLRSHPGALAGKSAPHPFAEIRITPKV